MKSKKDKNPNVNIMVTWYSFQLSSIQGVMGFPSLNKLTHRISGNQCNLLCCPLYSILMLLYVHLKEFTLPLLCNTFSGVSL